jgi:hypothetical protein
MNGLDNFLFKAVLQAIKNELNSEKIKNIEQRLEQEHGIKFSDLFAKFDEIKKLLLEFEDELKNIEDKILRDFLTVEKIDDSSEKWLVIKNKHLTELILKTLADDDKKSILNLTRDNAETIPRILGLCNLPNTSVYRKMNQLIDDCFVMPVGLSETFEGKRAILYKSIVQKIQIIINKNEIVTKVLVSKENLNSSQIVRTITEVIQGKANSFAN